MAGSGQQAAGGSRVTVIRLNGGAGCAGEGYRLVSLQSYSWRERREASTLYNSSFVTSSSTGCAFSTGRAPESAMTKGSCGLSPYPVLEFSIF